MTALHTAAERDRWLAFAATLPLPLEVTCKRWVKSRTSRQNRWLRALESDVAAHVGYTLDEVHEWLLGSFFGWVDRKVPRTPRVPSGIVSVPARTTTTDEQGKRNVLPRDDFAKFAAHAERIASEAGVFVADAWVE